jgi:outer membrane murein-binding lipoprotein Lpp
MIQNQQQEMTTKTESYDTLQQELKLKSFKVGELDQLVQSYISEVKYLKEKISQLEKDKEALEAKLATAEETLVNRNEHEISELVAKSENDDAQIGILKQAITSINEEKSAVETKLLGDIDKLTHKLDELASVEATLTSHQQRIKDLTAELLKVKLILQTEQPVAQPTNTTNPVNTTPIRSRRKRSNRSLRDSNGGSRDSCGSVGSDSERVVGRKRKGLFDPEASSKEKTNDENIFIIDVEDYTNLDLARERARSMFQPSMLSPDRQHQSKRIKSVTISPESENDASATSSTPTNKAKQFFSKLLNKSSNTKKERKSSRSIVRELLDDAIHEEDMPSSPRIESSVRPRSMQSITMTATTLPPSPTASEIPGERVFSPLDINSGNAVPLNLNELGLKLNKKKTTGRRSKPTRRKLNVHEDLFDDHE